MRPAYWVLPALWMAGILWFSSDTFSADATGSFLIPLLRWFIPGATDPQRHFLHQALRKLAHLTEYAILALLWYRACARGRGLSPSRSAWLAGLTAVGWAALDETRQTFTVTRVGSPADVALDSAGAAFALAGARLGWSSVGLVTSALLWTAAIGGVLFLALHAALGLASGWLWATTPAAWLLLWWRRRARRGAP
jgi:VanZ family protein